MYQGRGSAANSAVCFCLGVTAVDPVRMGLLFERFLSRERAEPPDIDLDIEHERRGGDQHVYQVYGRDHSAMVCNIIRYRPRSAVRDVGKALGIQGRARSRRKPLDVRPRRARGARAFRPRRSARSRSITWRGSPAEISEFPRLSVHPGGFLLGHEPVHDIVPIRQWPPTHRDQWDKDDLGTSPCSRSICSASARCTSSTSASTSCGRTAASISRCVHHRRGRGHV